MPKKYKRWLLIRFSNGNKNRHKASKHGSSRLRNGDCQKQIIEKKTSFSSQAKTNNLTLSQSLNHKDTIKKHEGDTEKDISILQEEDTSSSVENKSIHTTNIDARPKEASLVIGLKIWFLNIYLFNWHIFLLNMLITYYLFLFYLGIEF